MDVQEMMNETILRTACHTALAYNEQTLKSRRDLKQFYKEQRQTDRQLVGHGAEPKSNFLHCAYTPGTAFINTMNNQNQQRGGGSFPVGRKGTENGLQSRPGGFRSNTAQSQRRDNNLDDEFQNKKRPSRVGLAAQE